jgi:hypothetical protein
MSRFFAVLTVAVSLAVAAAALAQSESTTTKTKTKVKGGTTVSMTGCLRQTSDGFALENIDTLGGSPETPSATTPSSYVLLPGSDVKLAPHVGHKVTVTGKTGGGKDKMEVRQRTQTESTTGEKSKGETKVAGDKGYMGNVLHVSSVKMVSTSCP